MMLKLGGSILFKEKLGKKRIDPNSTEYVYQWEDQTMPLFKDHGDFFLAKDEE